MRRAPRTQGARLPTLQHTLPACHPLPGVRPKGVGHESVLPHRPDVLQGSQVPNILSVRRLCEHPPGVAKEAARHGRQQRWPVLLVVALDQHADVRCRRARASPLRARGHRFRSIGAHVRLGGRSHVAENRWRLTDRRATCRVRGAYGSATWGTDFRTVRMRPANALLVALRRLWVFPG